MFPPSAPDRRQRGTSAVRESGHAKSVLIAPPVLLLWVKTLRRWRATRIAHPHGKGFAREIPLLNVERLRPKIGPESEIDPVRENSGTPIGETHWEALTTSHLFGGLPTVTAFQGSAGWFAGAVITSKSF